MFKKLKILTTLSFCFFILSAHSEIFLDVEKDAIPVIHISVVMPIGYNSATQVEKVAPSLFSEILSSGTTTLNRQEFNDILSKFAAELNFSVDSQYSSWSLSIPYIESLAYDDLIKIIEENWKSPRFIKSSFELAITQLKSSFKSSLDSDTSILRSTLSDWALKKELNSLILSYDDIDKATLNTTKNMFVQKFQNTPNLYAGAVCPEAAIPLVKKILTQVFTAQGSIKESVIKNEIASLSAPSAKLSKKKQFIIIDKKDRTQTVMGFLAISPFRTKDVNELDFEFNNFLLFSNGLDAYFPSVIRTEKGLAYSVGSMGSNFQKYKSLSLLANPVREKQSIAFETIHDLTQSLFEQNNEYKIISDTTLNRLFTSFKNSRILDNVTSLSRLSKRMDVVEGYNSYDFLNSDPKKWKIKRESLSALSHKIWTESTQLIGAVGDAKELTPLAKKYFPNYEIITIPYEKTIYSDTYN